MNPSKRKKLFRMKQAEEKQKLISVPVVQSLVEKKQELGLKELPKKEETVLVKEEVKKEETVLVKEETKQEESVSLQGEMIGVLTPPVADLPSSLPTERKKKKV